MSKKFVLIILGQTLIFVIVLIYAFVQQGVAKELEVLAKANEAKAQEMLRAQEHAQKEMAVKFQSLSNKVVELENELTNCKKK